jgi:hypothetical protein
LICPRAPHLRIEQTRHRRGKYLAESLAAVPSCLAGKIAQRQRFCSRYLKRQTVHPLPGHFRVILRKQEMHRSSHAKDPVLDVKSGRTARASPATRSAHSHTVSLVTIIDEQAPFLGMPPDAGHKSLR